MFNQYHTNWNTSSEQELLPGNQRCRQGGLLKGMAGQAAEGEEVIKGEGESISKIYNVFFRLLCEIDGLFPS